MGFSDSFKKAIGQFSGFLGKPLPKKGFSKRAKEGKMTGRDYLGALTGVAAGGFTQESMHTQGKLMADPTNRDLHKQRLSGHMEGIKGSLFGANLGHQSIGAKLFEKPEGMEAPVVGSVPSQGAATIAAKRQARQRALNQASRRRGLGLSGTVRTSALGLQGDGAAVSQRRLIGE